MVQIKLTLASILVATAIAPAVAQPLGRRESFALEARTEPVPAHLPKHHVHHNHNHRQGERAPHHHHHHKQAVAAVDATQQVPSADPNAAAGPVTREYVDELEVRTEPVPAHVPKHHVHHNHNHRQGERAPHHHHHKQAVAAVDATQQAPSDPNAAAGPVTREYVDELEVRTEPVPAHVPKHHVHHNHNHRQGERAPHHHHHKQAVAAVDATQQAPSDPNAAAGPVTREYVDELEVRTEPVPAHVPKHHVHHNHNHRQGERAPHHHHHHKQAVAAVDATQQAPSDPNAAAGPVTREYVDELEIRSPVEIPTSAIRHAKRLRAAHANRKHNHNNGQRAPHHHHHHKQAVSTAVDATQQAPPTDPNATGGPVTREYVDELEVRSPVEIPTSAIRHAKRLRAAHANRKHNHNNGQRVPHHHHHHKQVVSNGVDAAQQAPPTDPNATGGPVTREYVDEELFGRDFDYYLD